MEDTLFPVSPIGDQDVRVHEPEAPSLREAPHQLYIVELQGWVEAATLPEQLAPQRDSMPGSGGECSLEAF
jgi:hypothetical protein